jgi:hypothetical protein
MGNSLSLYNTEAEGVAGATGTQKPIFNPYATWSMTFYGLYKAAIAGNQIYSENSHGVVAYKLRDDAILPVADDISEALSPVNIGDFISLIRDKMGDDLTPKDFKAFDLGGRDIKTIMGVMEGKVPSDKMPKFAGKIALMTGGTLASRAKCLYNIRNGPMDLAKTTDLSGPARISGLVGTSDWFLLNPDTETLFTGLSICGYIENNVDSYWNTLIVPVGSKDCHLIYIDGRGKFKFSNILNYGERNIEVFQTTVRELVGQSDIDRIVFAGSFVFGLETRKFLADEKTPDVGVEPGDLDLEKHCFKSVSESTGEVMLGKILASRGAIADEPENYDFSFITRSSGKGPELAQFLSNVFNNDFMRHQLENNVQDLLSFPRKSLDDLCQEDVAKMLEGFSADVRSTRRRRAVML